MLCAPSSTSHAAHPRLLPGCAGDILTEKLTSLFSFLPLSLMSLFSLLCCLAHQPQGDEEGPTVGTPSMLPLDPAGGWEAAFRSGPRCFGPVPPEVNWTYVIHPKAVVVMLQQGPPLRLSWYGLVCSGWWGGGLRIWQMQ